MKKLFITEWSTDETMLDRLCRCSNTDFSEQKPTK